MAAHPLHGRTSVMHCSRVTVLPVADQAVVDAEDRIATGGQMRAQIPVEIAAAQLVAATMHSDDGRVNCCALGQVEITDKGVAVMSAVLHSLARLHAEVVRHECHRDDPQTDQEDVTEITSLTARKLP